MAKRVTIEQLAKMIASGFTEFSNKFSSLEVRMDRLELSTDEILLRLGSKADKFEVKDLTKRVTKIEKHLGFSN